MLGQGEILHITIDVYLNFGGKIRWWKGFRSIDRIRYLECGVMYIKCMFWQAIISYNLLYGGLLQNYEWTNFVVSYFEV